MEASAAERTGETGLPCIAFTGGMLLPIAALLLPEILFPDQAAGATRLASPAPTARRNLGAGRDGQLEGRERRNDRFWEH